MGVRSFSMPHFSDDLYLGNAITEQGMNTALGEPSPMSKGVGPLGRIFIFDAVPLTLQVAGLAASQTPGAAGNLTLSAGTGVTVSMGFDGVLRYVLDTPRVVTVTAAGNESAVTFTVFGFDQYGQAMSQAMAGPNANTVSTLKAFKSVTRVAVSAATGGAITAGYGNTFGLPVRVTDAGYIVHAGWAGALAADAGTFVSAVTTDPATAATGDVRGTFAPSSAADGVKRLVIAIAIPAIGSGPQATRQGALGVNQV